MRFSKAWVGCTLGLSAVMLSACWGVVDLGGGSGGGGGTGSSSGSSGAGGAVPFSVVDKVDLLLVVDNSRSMADKQQVLALTAADLVDELVNPACVDSLGKEVKVPSPVDACPVGFKRRFDPVKDMHVGIISTSIGGHGADSCPDVDTASAVCKSIAHYTNNDKGHLLARTDPCSGQQVPTYDSKGFLAWDPLQKQSPPGMADQTELATTVASIVVGVGQIGCGYESQLESWYRFLADPEPYQSINVTNFEAIPLGEDSELLAQRTAFLRPDSMLVILMLTDENDCSIKEYDQYYYVGQLRLGSTPVRIPRARQECTTKGPNDPCCLSCGMSDQGSCPPDPTCSMNNGLLTQWEDQINLRCWDQKRRFGIDFLYPVDRYIQALTSTTIPNRNGQLVPNPIFSDLDPNDDNTTIRDPGLVIMAAIAGVLWQEIATDPSDLTLGFKNAKELAQNGTWDAIIGDPANDVPPTSPYMIESVQPRPGIAPGNPINGGEWTIAENNDLQYACIYPLATPRDCTNTSLASCDCQDATNDNPVCAPNPNDGGQRTLQVAAKAYPGRRVLSVIKGLGNQGLLGSVCPAQMTDDTPNARDYAYRPAVQSLVKQMASRL